MRVNNCVTNHSTGVHSGCNESASAIVSHCLAKNVGREISSTEHVSTANQCEAVQQQMMSQSYDLQGTLMQCFPNNDDSVPNSVANISYHETDRCTSTPFSEKKHSDKRFWFRVHISFEFCWLRD